MGTIVSYNGLLKIDFQLIRKLINKRLKIRNKSTDCSKITILMPKISLRCTL